MATSSLYAASQPSQETLPPYEAIDTSQTYLLPETASGSSSQPELYQYWLMRTPRQRHGVRNEEDRVSGRSTDLGTTATSSLQPQFHSGGIQSSSVSGVKFAMIPRKCDIDTDEDQGAQPEAARSTDESPPARRPNKLKKRLSQKGRLQGYRHQFSDICVIS